MALEMKYFVLKPRSKKLMDPWAEASRAAMLAFATEIESEDSEAALALRKWVNREELMAQKERIDSERCDKGASK